MKKSTKGAIAAAAAGTLLLGGAGSLAYWTDSAQIGGGTITSGTLKLTDTTGPGAALCAAAPWTFDASDTHAGAYVAGDKIVPGDVLSKVCTFTIAASGKHLSATVAPTGGVGSGALSTAVTVAGTYTVNNTALANDTITSAQDTQTLRAKITLTFPYGDATTVSNNGTQAKDVNISAYSLALTQVH